jgi:hypothetical protein
VDHRSLKGGQQPEQLNCLKLASFPLGISKAKIALEISQSSASMKHRLNEAQHHYSINLRHQFTYCASIRTMRDCSIDASRTRLRTFQIDEPSPMARTKLPFTTKTESSTGTTFQRLLCWIPSPPEWPNYPASYRPIGRELGLFSIHSKASGDGENPTAKN